MGKADGTDLRNKLDKLKAATVDEAETQADLDKIKRMINDLEEASESTRLHIGKEEAAAIKIQAIHRGNAARKAKAKKLGTNACSEVEQQIAKLKAKVPESDLLLATTMEGLQKQMNDLKSKMAAGAKPEEIQRLTKELQEAG